MLGVNLHSARARRRSFVVAAAVASFGIRAHPAAAQTSVNWISTIGSYVNPSNWSSGSTPSNTANEFLTINNGGTAQVNLADSAEGNFLTLGASAGDSGNLQIS